MDDELFLDQLLTAWRTNNRINLYLIKHIDDNGMLCSLSKRGGRTVGRQFAHMHNNRIWLLQARAKDLSHGLYVFESKEEPERKLLIGEMKLSALRIEQFFSDVHEGKPKRRTFKKGLISHLSYLVAHESHHRGSILLTLKECGHKLDNLVAMEIWNWDKM